MPNFLRQFGNRRRLIGTAGLECLAVRLFASLLVCTTVFLTFFGLSARSQAAEPTKQDAADDNSADSKPADADNKESSDSQAKADKDSKTTYKVVAGPFRIDLKLEGIVEPRQMSEVILRTDQWTDLTVREAAAHGATVKKGDTILSLDLTKIRQEIKELETTLKLDEIASNLAKAEIEASEKSSPEDLAEAERAAKLADVDLKYFLETGRERLVRSGEFGVKMYSQTLENAEEELKQLEKMYKADDLTEGTEEIILKQQRFQVALAAYLVEEAKVARDRLTQIDLPREETTLRESLLRKNLALQKARGELPLHLGKLRLDFVKLKAEQQESKEKLAKLKHDEALMTVRAPADGIVLYGECEYGHWSHASDMAGKLRRGGSVTTHEVLMTIVAPSPLYVRVTLPEKDLSAVAAGQTGTFTLTGFPDAHFAAKVESVPALADPTGKYTAPVNLEGAGFADPAVRATPGMGGELKCKTYFKADALTVPTKAIHDDETDNSKHYVQIVSDDKDKPLVRRDVTIGRHNDEHTEILQGLQAGDLVSLKKPDDE